MNQSEHGEVPDEGQRVLNAGLTRRANHDKFLFCS